MNKYFFKAFNCREYRVVGRDAGGYDHIIIKIEADSEENALEIARRFVTREKYVLIEIRNY